jgi:exopolyphosphatase/guanosine-5'-triphosphate,3'-diphosphate pyrophosphatase
VAQGLGLVESGITQPALKGIMQEMVAARRVDDLNLPGLASDRAPVFAGGVAILAEILNALGIERLQISEGALREGLLYDLLGRLQQEDARERTIRAMQLRYHVDEEQAQRTEATAVDLLARVASPWTLVDERYAVLLRWGARLHEVGLDIAHSKYHQHGGYLLANADMPGFVRLEQQLLATLVGYHRRKLDDLALEMLPERWREPCFKLIVLLRLAVLLNRSRSPVELPAIELTPGSNRLGLQFPKDWFLENPLTQADLSQEQAWLEARGFQLHLA